jgi:membrane-bound lytic murein transglycosylase A
VFRALILACVLVSIGCENVSADNNGNIGSDNNPPGGENGTADDGPPATFSTPTKKVADDKVPQFSDDMDFRNMNVALDRQLVRFAQMDLNRTIRYGKRVVKIQNLRDSLVDFKAVVQSMDNCKKEKSTKSKCIADLNSQIKKKFEVYEPALTKDDPRFGESKPTLFTGYYTPTIQGKMTPNEEYRFPVYRMPETTELSTLDRISIDFKGKLKGKNLELFYTNDLFALYLMHVQGGGRVGNQYLTYTGGNGLPFGFLSPYMISKGYISSGTIEAQREFLKNNPDKWEEIYANCPNYVYFEPTDEPPHGNDMVSLTNGRSIATDRNFYKLKGGLAFVMAERPIKNANGQVEMKKFSRFFLDQDTGGAIKGKARVDLFYGEDAYAEFAAYNTKQRGDVFFLIKK